MAMTDKEKKAYVNKHLTDIYPQLVENMQKTCGAGYEKWGDDLLPTAIEFFLNKPLDVQYESCVSGKCENFITFIAAFQLKSSTTKFWHVWRKHKNSHRELIPDSYMYDETKYKDDSDDDFMLCIKQQMKDLDPFEKMLVEERVIKGMRFVDLEERYDIPYSALAKELKKVLKKIKERCQHLR
jgi:hypothetical protein